MTLKTSGVRRGGEARAGRSRARAERMGGGGGCSHRAPLTPHPRDCTYSSRLAGQYVGVGPPRHLRLCAPLSFLSAPTPHIHSYGTVLDHPRYDAPGARVPLRCMLGLRAIPSFERTWLTSERDHTKESEYVEGGTSTRGAAEGVSWGWCRGGGTGGGTGTRGAAVGDVVVGGVTLRGEGCTCMRRRGVWMSGGGGEVLSLVLAGGFGNLCWCAWCVYVEVCVHRYASCEWLMGVAGGHKNAPLGGWGYQGGEGGPWRTCVVLTTPTGLG